VVVGLVKDNLIQLEKGSERVDIVKAVQTLAHADLLKNFGDVAVGMIDDYLASGNDDAIYLEPGYRKTNDLNAFLKSEKLGKDDEFSPNLRTQIIFAKKDFRRGAYLADVNKFLTETI
jgi:hypothetical protein